MSVAEAAVPEWSALAKHILYHVLAPTHQPVHSEMITDRIGKPRGETGQHRNNAVGSIMSGAAKRGILIPIDRMNAEHPESHANNRNVWIWTGKVLAPEKGKKIYPCPLCPGYI
jgi:hypothetical protein